MIEIVKILLPKFDLIKKLGDYVNTGPYNEWLVHLSGGATWDAGIDIVNKEANLKVWANKSSLF